MKNGAFTKFICRLLVVSILLALLMGISFAHSGRTDSNGGHNDPKNVSGLGSYHYHHGYPAHLHPDGICPYAPKDTIRVDNMPSAMFAGDSVSLTWTVTYYSGSSSVSWSSSDSDIVSISGGVLTAKGVGTATITATLHNGSASYRITVKQVYAKSIELQNIPDRLELGDSVKAVAVLDPSNTTDKSITWATSNSNIAAIDDTGKIVALSIGTVTITASAAGGAKASAQLEVFEILLTALEVESFNIAMPLGRTHKIITKVLPEDTTRPNLEWESSDHEIVSVVDGVLTGNRIGEAVVYAKCQDIEVAINVVVQEIKAELITLSIDSVIMDINDIVPVKATVQPDDTTNAKIIWTSSDNSVVKVAGSGILTPVSAGIAVITAQCGDVSTQLSVEVCVFPKTIKIDVDKALAKGYIRVGDTIDLHVIFDPEDVTYPEYALYINNEKLAAISGSTLTANHTGTIIITAINGTLTDEIGVVIRSSIGTIVVSWVVPFFLLSGIGIFASIIFRKTKNRVN